MGDQRKGGIAWTETMIARYWRGVDRGAPEACWAWKEGRFARGYGQIRVGTKKMKAHRVAWMLTHGPIPDGLLVCHNPPCCNPAHLFLGTSSDNAQDRERKGRGKARLPPPMPADANPAARLTWDQVRCIRRDRSYGMTLRSIANAHGCSVSQVRNIVLLRCWKEPLHG